MTVPARTAWIEGLCTWRALLMLGGIALHATMGREGYPPFAAINMVSNAFRMGVFFVISGLLAGLAIQRREDPAQWLRQRLVRLGVPTLFGLTVICPLTSLMLATGLVYPVGPMPMAPSMYHFWFLVALIGYTLIGFWFERIDRRWQILARADRDLRSPRFLRAAMLLGGGSVCFVLMVAGIHLGALVPPPFAALGGPLRQMLGYLPLYAIGFAAARMPRWRTATLYEVMLPAGLLTAIVVANVVWWYSGLPATLPPATHRWIQEVLIVGTASWCPPAVAVLVLRSAVAARQAPPLFHRLSDASFTMYILHYPIIVATKIAITPLIPGPWAEFALSVAAGGGLSFWFHEALVERQPLLMLLFNGRHGCVPAGQVART